ncbi:MAG: methyltransferase [Synergistaceae bacterium]|jgi:tRNA1(Val) A37 N6-methylase TrmN6|nr:methyltransferase [Synergistaceae bacterium]
MRRGEIIGTEISGPDDILYGELKLFQPGLDAGPRVNVDTILLAHFARFPDRAKAIELGCAHGAVSLIIAQRRRKRKAWFDSALKPGDGTAVCAARQIDAFDINPSLIELARKNAEINGLSGYVNFFTADLRNCRKNFEAGSYDAVVMNPPYDEAHKSRPSASDAMASALHGAQCSLADVAAAAKYLLDNRGKLFLVMRAKRTTELFSLLDRNNVRPKRLRAVHPRPGRAASVILVEAIRASADGLVIEPPLFILGHDGKYTEELLEAYKLDEKYSPSGEIRCRS